MKVFGLQISYRIGALNRFLLSFSLCACVLLSHTLRAQEPIPYSTGFESSEGYSVGDVAIQGDWSVDSGSANVVSGAGANSSSQYVVLEASDPFTQISVVLTPVSGQTVYFGEFYVKPKAGTNNPVIQFLDQNSMILGLVKVGADGVIYALDGDGNNSTGTWVTTSKAYTLDANDVTSEWIQLNIRADLGANQIWDLYLDGDISAVNLGIFDPNVSSFVALMGDTQEDTYVDEVSVTVTNPLFPDADSDGLSDEYELSRGLNPNVNDRDGDLDNDGITNIEEALAGTLDIVYVDLHAITGLQVTAGSSDVSLEWSDNSIGEDGYQIDRSADGGVSWTSIYIDEDSHSYNDIGVSEATDYTYRVFAYSGQNTATAVEISTETTLDLSISSSNLRTTATTRIHCLFIDANNVLWGMGHNTWKQLGDDNLSYKTLPYQIAENVVKVDAGANHTVWLTTSGEVYGVGRSYEAELGINGWKESTPVFIADNVVDISVGWTVTTYLTADGKLYGIGEDEDGYLGNTNLSIPLYVTDPPVLIASNVATMSASEYHLAYITNDMELYMSGTNQYGQLGNGTTNGTVPYVKVMDDVVQVAAGRFNTYAITKEGHLYTWGYSRYGVNGNGTSGINAADELVPHFLTTKVVAASVGNVHGLFLKHNGELWGMGRHYKGILGQGDMTNNTVNTPVLVETGVTRALSAGNGSTLFVKTDGTVYSMGMNNQGQLGIGNTIDQAWPQAVGAHKAYLPGIDVAPVLGTPDGLDCTLDAGVVTVVWNDNAYYEDRYTIVRSDDGGATWGTPIQIPPNSTSYQDSNIQVGNAYQYSVYASQGAVDGGYASVALNELGSITGLQVTAGSNNVSLSWSDNSFGEDGYQIDRSEDGGASWTSIYIDAESNSYNDTDLSDATDYTYRVFAYSGQNTATAVEVSTETTLDLSISSSNLRTVETVRSHSLFIDENNVLWGMGHNSWKQLGDDNLSYKTLPYQIAQNVAKVDSGSDHTVWLTTSGEVYGVGRSYEAELGINGWKESTPVFIADNVVDISVGWTLTTYLTADGELYGVGEDEDGYLGNTNLSTPLYVTDPPVLIATNVATMSASEYHLAYITNNMELYMSGTNQYGQLGNGSTNATVPYVKVMDDVVQVAAGRYNTYAITKEGHLYTWGHSRYGVNGNGTSGINAADELVPRFLTTKVVAVSVGHVHGLFLKHNGELWGMGRHTKGILGRGDLTNHTVNTPVLVETDVTRAISAGYTSTLFVKTDGTIYAMGQNHQGQLGIGNIVDQAWPQPVGTHKAYLPLTTGADTDGDGANDEDDADPYDPNVGQISITILTPANGENI